MLVVCSSLSSTFPFLTSSGENPFPPFILHTRSMKCQKRTCRNLMYIFRYMLFLLTSEKKNTFTRVI